MFGRGAGVERIITTPEGKIVVKTPPFPPIFPRSKLDSDYCSEPQIDESVKEDTSES